MLKDITASGRYVVANGNSGSSMPYVPSNANNPIQGMIRINNQDMQVFDGSGWVTMYNSVASVGLTPETEALLDWVKSKQRQEIELLELASQNQAVLTALENVKKAQEQLTIIAHLSRETNETTS
jgi:hypothetical protein